MCLNYSFRIILEELKEEYKKASYERKLQILTLSPFNITETMTYFGATKYLVNKARAWKKLYGILPEVPKYSKGKILSGEQIKEVISFYEDDEISRLCPGKSDYLSVRMANGKKEHVQKRLLLSNLKELFPQYKSNSKDPVGFSTFAKLRPKWCVIAGPQGTHNVCVCTHHQNPKLMVAGIGNKDVTYKILMEKCVCDMHNDKCMLGQCRNCPGKIGVEEYLKTLPELDERDNISYLQWISTDRSTLTTIVSSTDEFIATLSSKILSLTRHHYISKSQSEYLKYCKQNLDNTEVLILGDFSENYSFVVQDASQSFHWSNSQATVHPFVVYYKNENTNCLNHNSFCFISDSLTHSVAAVHAFLKELLPAIKDILPKCTKVHYFSDGCAGQYKNKYNFINLCYHSLDFGMNCEWNFFGTSHGKNACDGIGGVVKRAAAKESLQRVGKSPIITPLEFFKFCENYFDDIKFFYTPSDDILKTEERLQSRFQNALTLKGTQGFHKIIPNTLMTIKAFKTSQSNEYTIHQISNDVSLPSMTNFEYNIGQYVLCTYDNIPYIGLIEEISDEHLDYKINFMHKVAKNKFSFSSSEDKCWVLMKNILNVLSTPKLNAGVAITYSFDTKEAAKFPFNIK